MLGNLWMLCLCLCSCWAEAHIWAWMLNMPHSPPKEGAKALREHTPVAKAPTVRRRRVLSITMKYQTLFCPLRKLRRESCDFSKGVLTCCPPSPQAVCDHDRACGRGFSCDRHFGLCVPLRGEGHYCRRDVQCVRGLSCMFGKCHRSVPTGQEGETATRPKPAFSF